MWKTSGKRCVKREKELHTILWIMGINKDETHVLIKNTMKTRIFSSKSVDNPVHSVHNFVENLRIS